MTRTLARTLMALGMVSAGAFALAQEPPIPIGWAICIDPTNTTPYSTDYLAYTRANLLFRVCAGISGTVTYGGQNSPCFPTAHTYNAGGRIGFASGPQGSQQSNFDDDLMYTYGMGSLTPAGDPAGPWSYATTVRIDPTDATQTPTYTLIGQPIGTAFVGASGRYLYFEKTADNIFTQIRADIVGDGCRIQWKMTNLAATAQELGLWYGADMGILTTDGQDSGALGSPMFIVVPGQKPMIVDTRKVRSTNPANFPPYIQLVFGQTNAYGLQVDLGPTAATSDLNGQNSDATNADEVVIGHDLFVRGDPIGGNDVNPPPDVVFGDTTLRGDTAFVQKYYPQAGGSIATNASRTIISYYHDTWGNSKYTRPSPVQNRPSDQPYTTVIDAPHILVQDDSNTGTNGLGNNPFTIRAYVDNVGGYSDVYTGIQINDVRITLNLPDGMSFINGDQATKVISQVNPLELQAVDWQVQSDGIVVGDLPYTVTITSTPGPNQAITHNGIIRVSATKQIPLQPSANLISTPWVFADSSWETVLGLSTPSDFTAYEWDPVQNSYVISTSASRGKGVWMILNPNSHPVPEVDPYFGAGSPNDMQSGAPNLQLHSGWNLIGDPYPYALPVSQLVGVSAANPAQSFIFSDLVSQNIVSPYLAYWDSSVNNYRYVQGIAAIMQPNVGYWIKVQTAQDLTLNFPPIWDTFVPGGRAPGSSWAQTGTHWKLNLQGRANHGQDNDNYVGVATGVQPQDLVIPEAPAGPTQDLTVSIDGAPFGQGTRLAQGLYDHGGQLTWTVYVASKSGGPVTLSWPNMATLPSNVTFRLTDPVTHQSVDMRSRSSIMFTAGANSTRQFTIESSSSGSGQPAIGNVLTAAGRLTGNIPATGSYVLNYDATVTVRVLDNRGSVVTTLVNGAKLRKGTNRLTWNLKDSGGNYVAAGTYQFAISATVNGATSNKLADVVVGR